LTDSTPLRILLIDDNKHGLDARRVLLEDLGYQIDTACCGEEGLTEFEKAAFDLVVTDYRMPDLHGSEVIKRIRTLNASVPIVMLSGYVEKLGLTKEQIGADMVLAKGPNEDRDLARSIARLVKKKPSSESGGRRTRKARGAAL
jgi:CheY-like chemotaxis protein